MREQEANRLAVVCTTACLCQCRADIDRMDLVALLLLIAQWDSVADDNAARRERELVKNSLET